jgi:hypothetical protein
MRDCRAQSFLEDERAMFYTSGTLSTPISHSQGNETIWHAGQKYCGGSGRGSYEHSDSVNDTFGLPTRGTPKWKWVGSKTQWISFRRLMAHCTLSLAVVNHSVGHRLNQGP